MRTSQLHWNITGTTYQIATVTFYLATTNTYGHQSEPTIRKDCCNYDFNSSLFIYHDISIIIINPLSLTFSQAFIYLNSVQLMSIMDHFGYSTRPLVEYNLDLYTDRASFLGWLNHMSERKRLAITLDPASSEPTRFKNKRVQVSMEHSPSKRDSEIEMTPVPQSLPSQPTTSHPPSAQKYPGGGGKTTKSGKRKKGVDSDVEYKPPSKPEKPKSKRSSSRKGSSKAKASSTKPNTSSYGNISEDLGGKCPKHLYSTGQEISDSEVSLNGKDVDYEGHSDSFTDS